MQQLELSRREFERLAGLGHFGPPEIHRDVAKAIASVVPSSRGCCRGAAAEECFHPGEQLRHLEWLDQVVVGAELQADDLVHDLAAGGQHQDRRLEALLSQRAADVEPVAAGQHHVQQDQRRRVAGSGGVERRAASMALSTS